MKQRQRIAPTFICAECQQPVRERHRQFRERLEYPSADVTKRLHVVTLRDLCIDCVEVIWNRAEPPTVAADAWRTRRKTASATEAMF